MRSPDEETFCKGVEEFEKQYLLHYIEEVGYIKTTWLLRSPENGQKLPQFLSPQTSSSVLSMSLASTDCRLPSHTTPLAIPWRLSKPEPDFLVQVSSVQHSSGTAKGAC